jgi:hypothetical protein
MCKYLKTCAIETKKNTPCNVCVQFHIQIVHGIDSPFQLAYGVELTSPIKSEKNGFFNW